MNILLFLLRHRLLIVFLILLLFLFLITVLLFLTRGVDSPRPSDPQTFPTPIPLQPREINLQQISPLQKTTIGRTTEDDVEKIFAQGEKEIINQNETKYSIPSSVNLLPHEVVVENGIVVFERIIAPKDKTSPSFAKLSDYIDYLGQPEEIVTGSKLYGDFISTYIYAKRGLAIVGNNDADIVYEFHKFMPIATNEYKERYGTDLNSKDEPVGEYFDFSYN